MAADASAARKAAPPNGGALSDAELREGAMEGALVAAGELGYREASVRAILEYSGANRNRFYRLFESKEDCFAQAYATWIERLCLRLVEEAVAEDGWQRGVRAALIALFRFVTEKPAIARALFVEVQIAGEPALSRHDAAMARLAAALDSARAEIPAGEAPPEATGSFVVGGIEASVSEALSGGDPRRIWDALPELMHFAAGSYLGREAAEAAFEEASELLARDRARLIGGGG